LNESGTVTNTRSWLIGSARRASGRLTSMPRCMSGAVTIKMISMTSMTSTSGMTLISESEVPTRATRPRRALDKPTGSLFRIFGILAAYVKFRSAMFRNSSEKSSSVDA
jgi:hypothetical protein